MKHKLKVLDLFSGIGGFSLGLERTGGFETIAFCEIDESCRRVLHRHWPKVPRLTDIKMITNEYIRFNGKSNLLYDIDVICGGFPCQDISVAGKGKGLQGERSGLWTEFKRIIQEVNPQYAIIENVANLRGKGLSTIIKDLWKIGYDCEWHIISACGVGAVHRRERIWIIAYPHSTELRKQSRRRIRTYGEGEVFIGTDGQEIPTTNTDHVRLWSSFTTPEEKQKWWSETTARFSDVFNKITEIESTVCRSDDGVSNRLHKDRIKQLGNSVLPQIPELIGNCILEHELRNQK